MSSTKISLPKFKLRTQQAVHLVNTAADALRMGGVANNVYFSSQSVYAAALALAASPVTIYCYETKAASVGNISLTTTFNSNISIVGEGSIVSEIGNITIANATGAQTSTFALISNCKIGNITTSGAGAIASGNVVINIANAIIGNIVTSGAAAAGGSVTINVNSLTTISRSVYINSIVTGAANQVAGVVSILEGFGIKLGSLTTGIGASSSGGAISLSFLETVGAIISQSFSGSSALNLTGIKSIGAITHNSAGGSFSFRQCVFNGSITSNVSVTGGNMLDCFFNSGITLSFTNTGTGNFSIQKCLFGSTISLSQTTSVSPCPIQNSIFTTLNGNSNCILRPINCTFATISNFVGSSVFSNCTMTSTVTGIVPTVGGLGGQFQNCSFTSGGNIFTATSNCYVEAFGSTFLFTALSAGTVAIRTEKEHVFTVQTTNNTSTALATIPIPTGQRVRLLANICASSGTDTMMNIVVNIFKNNAGTVVKVGLVDESEINVISDASLAGVSAAFAVSGTNAVLNVVGLSAATVTWNVSIKAISTF